MAIELKLHEPFQKLLRPLTDDELALLRDKILQDGAIYPIDVDQHGRVVDGYHTLEIYRGEGLSNFPVRERDFASDEDAEEWIILNQLSRRNVHGPDYTLLLGELYNRQKKQRGGDRRSSAQNEHLKKSLEAQDLSEMPVSHLGSTADIVAADERHVSAATVRRGGQRAKAVEKLVENLAAAYRAGTLKLTEAELLALAKKNETEQLTMQRAVRTGQKASWSDALGLKKKKSKTDKQTPAKKAPSVLKDKHGHLVDKKHLVEVFTDTTIKDMVTEVKKLIVKAKSLRGDKSAFVTLTSIVEHATAIVQALENGLPAYICPACKGNRCKWCRKSGWMPAWAYTDYKLKATE